MFLANKTKLSPAVCAAVLQVGHDTHAPRFQVGPVVYGRLRMDCRPPELVWRCQSFAIWGQRHWV